MISDNILPRALHVVQARSNENCLISFISRNILKLRLGLGLGLGRLRPRLGIGLGLGRLIPRSEMTIVSSHLSHLLTRGGAISNSARNFFPVHFGKRYEINGLI